ncbi:MAG: hypothetical protein K0S28_1557 [Paucimonas sp.]|nr:hypothetical protein [Paucimonas sp.]
MRRQKNKSMSTKSQISSVNVLLIEDDAVTRRIMSLAIEAAQGLRLAASFDSVKPAHHAIPTATSWW